MSHPWEFPYGSHKQQGTDRPLALGGHVTNASFKQWLGILLMTKIDRAYKNYLTPEIWEETHLREIFYGTLIFQPRSNLLFVLAAMLEGIILPSIFSTLSLKFKCKICSQKEVIHNFENHILVTLPATNLLILRKCCGFEKPNHYYFFLRYDPLIIFRRQNHITFIFIKIMSYCKWPIALALRFLYHFRNLTQFNAEMLALVMKATY